MNSPRDAVKDSTAELLAVKQTRELAIAQLAWLEATPGITEDEACVSLTRYSQVLAQSFDAKIVLEGSLRVGVMDESDEDEARRLLGVLIEVQGTLQEIVARSRMLTETGVDAPKPGLKFQPIRKLPEVAVGIEAKLAFVAEELDVLRYFKTCDPPALTELDLDDFDEQLSWHIGLSDIVAEQLQRWQRARRTAAERAEIARLEKLNAATRALVSESQAVAKELRTRTLERAFAMLRPKELMERLEQALQERCDS